MDNLYSIEHIIKRISNTQIIEYVCLKNLESELYAVLSANFYYLDNYEKQQFNKQTIELLLDESPQIRCKWFQTLTEAIQKHDLDFI